MNGIPADILKVLLTLDAAQYFGEIAKAENRALKMSQKLSNIGNKMALGITAPLAAFGAKSVQSFATFDKAMTQSTAIMSGVTKDVRQEMEALAKQLSMEGSISATELAEAYYFLAAAGFDVEQSMAALGKVQSFAIAGNFNMARATDLLTDAQSALGLTSKDAAKNLEGMTRVGDVLVRANTLANSSVEQFAKALTTKAAAALRNLNKDVEEGVAVLAAYADQGIKAEQSGERFNILLRELQRGGANKKISAEWLRRDMKVFDEATGKMLPIVEIIEQLEAATSNLSDKERVQLFKDLGFMQEAQDAINSLLGTSSKIREYERELRNAGGMVEKVRANQKSFTSELNRFQNQINVISIEIGERLAPSISALNDRIAAGMAYWHALSESQKDIIVNIAKITAVTGPLLVISAKMIQVIIMTTKQLRILNGMIIMTNVSMKALRSTMAVFLLPFIKIIAIAALVGAAIAGLIRLIGGPGSLAAMWDTAKTKMGSFVTSAMGFMANLATNIGIAVAWIQANWRDLLVNMAIGFAALVKSIPQRTWVVVKTLIRMWTAWTGWFMGKMTDVLTYVFSVEFAKQVWSGIVSAVTAIKSFVTSAVAMFGAFLTEAGALFITFGTGVAKVFLGVPKAILRTMVAFGPIFGRVIKDILSGNIPNPAAILADMGAAVAASAAEFAKEIGDEFYEAAVKAGEKIGEVAGNIADKAQEGIDQLQEDFGRGAASENIFDTLGQIAREGAEQITNPFDGIEFRPIEGPKFEWGEFDQGVKELKEGAKELEAVQEDLGRVTKEAEPLKAAAIVPPSVASPTRPGEKAKMAGAGATGELMAILAGTAEGVARLAEHRAAMGNKVAATIPKANAGVANRPPAPIVNATASVKAISGEDRKKSTEAQKGELDHRNRVEESLRQIAANTALMAKKPNTSPIISTANISSNG